MLTITLEDDNLIAGILEQTLYLHDEMFNIAEESMICSHLAITYESTEMTSNAFETIGNAFKDMFKRLKNFFKTMIDKFISMFNKKISGSSMIRERISASLKSGANMEPFSKNGYNYNFTNNIEGVMQIAQGESLLATQSLNEILKNGIVPEAYVGIKSTSSLINSEDNINGIRLKIVRVLDPSYQGGPIPDSQFIPQLKTTLRGGTSTMTTINFTKETLLQYIDKDIASVEIRKKLESYKKNITVLLDTLTNDCTNAVKVISNSEWTIDSKAPGYNNNVKVINSYSDSYSQASLAMANLLFSSYSTFFKKLSETLVTSMNEYNSALIESMDFSTTIYKEAISKLDREVE